MNIVIKLLFVFTIAIFALCCNGAGGGNPANSTPIDQQTYRSTSIVKAVDREAGRITLDHDDIPGYMSAMEMNEAVSDRQMLEGLKTGQKIGFEIERTGANVVITKITRMSEAFVGSEIYAVNCATCHGPSGEGAKKGIPLISGHALHHSEAEYIERVENGKGKKMPAFNDKLSKEEIEEVVRFIRNDLQKNPPENKAAPKSHHHH